MGRKAVDVPAHHLPVLREVAECHQKARATSQWDIVESLMVPSDWRYISKRGCTCSTCTVWSHPLAASRTNHTKHSSARTTSNADLFDRPSPLSSASLHLSEEVLSEEALRHVQGMLALGSIG